MILWHIKGCRGCELSMLKARPIPCLVLTLLGLLGTYIAIWPNPVPFGGLDERRIVGIAGDHVLHMVAFALISLLLPHLLHDPPPWTTLLTVLVGAAVLSEAIQALFPWKRFDWGDVLSNLIGVTLGCAVGWAVQAWRERRRPSRASFLALDSV